MASKINTIQRNKVYLLHFTKTFFANISTATGDEHKEVSSEKGDVLVALAPGMDKEVASYYPEVEARLRVGYTHRDLVEVKIDSAEIVDENVINVG